MCGASCTGLWWTTSSGLRAGPSSSGCTPSTHHAPSSASRGRMPLQGCAAGLSSASVLCYTCVVHAIKSVSELLRVTGVQVHDPRSGQDL